MEEATTYTVKITAEAEIYYYEILKYFYNYHSEQSANRKSSELLDLAVSLEIVPQRGTIEDKLKRFRKNTDLFFIITRLVKPSKSSTLLMSPLKMFMLQIFSHVQWMIKK